MKELIYFQEKISACKSASVVDIVFSTKSRTATYVIRYVENNKECYMEVKLNNIIYCRLDEKASWEERIKEKVLYLITFLREKHAYIVYFSLGSERYYVKCNNIEIGDTKNWEETRYGHGKTTKLS